MSLSASDLGQIRSLFLEVFETTTAPRFNAIDLRLDNLENRLTKVESSMTNLESQMSALETRMDALEIRMSVMESNMNVLESRMDTLELRLEAVEVKVDVIDKRLFDLGREVAQLDDKLTSVAGETQALRNDVIEIYDRYEKPIPGKLVRQFQHMSLTQRLRFLQACVYELARESDIKLPSMNA